MAPKGKQVPESFKSYEDGKHRRYNLLFAVNGGAFAIAKLFAAQNAAAVLGNLSLGQLSIGMILFTIVMVADIYAFGWKMKEVYKLDVFGRPGKTVLVLLGMLICAGWFLVACNDGSLFVQKDREVLTQLNVRIGEAESKGDRNSLDGVLAAKLAFQRANDTKSIVDRQEFLTTVAPGSKRDTEVESIQLYGDRAVVASIVTLRPGGQRYHNLRLFVRREDGWKLLGWANEPR
jgi:hypothetical protein